MSQLEQLDIDDTKDENFIYYLKVRAFDIDSMREDYNTYFSANVQFIDNNNFYMDRVKTVFQLMASDPAGTQRLTDQEIVDIYDYVKNYYNNNYTNDIELSLTRQEYGDNVKRNGAIHWNLFILDFNTSYEWLINSVTLINDVTLVDFPTDPYENTSLISTTVTNYDTFINTLVETVQKLETEQVQFKLFLQDYNVEITSGTNLTELEDLYYAALTANSEYSYTKAETIERLEDTKRWIRRVVAKTLVP